MLLAFYLVVLHFIGDFILQTDWMAINKSKRLDALLFHVHVYCAMMLLGLWLVIGFTMAFTFASFTFVAHFATDWVTSRMNARLWAANERHWFFVGIGADQVLHYGQLFLTTHLLGL